MKSYHQNKINVEKKSKDGLYKIYFKKNGASILLFKNLYHYNAEIRVNALTAMYPDWLGRFIITK